MLPLSSPSTISFPKLKPFPKPFETEITSIHIELAFLNRSRQWLYKLQQGAKRLFDVIVASLGLIAIAPVLLAIALLIKCTSNGPVLYTSERIGKNFKPFGMYKFRTMCVNADCQQEALRQQANLQGELFKIENDPRVTAAGKWLRAFSLDELPQLLNVIKGDMSLVGPRPLPKDESALFQEPYTIRFHVHPGITGLWQVSGRSKLSFPQLCRLEMDYVTQWNVWMDLRILAQTIPAVLFRKGAY